MQTAEYKKAKTNKLRNSRLEDGFRQTVQSKKTTVWYTASEAADNEKAVRYVVC